MDLCPQCLAEERDAEQAEHESLLAVIRKVHAEKGDDLCWMDIDRIFAATGLPVPDRSVGDKAAMLSNCSRFIDTMCQGGRWRSYRELEASVAELSAVVLRLLSTFYGQDEGDPPPYPNMTSALYAAVNAVDRAEGRQPTYQEEWAP